MRKTCRVSSLKKSFSTHKSYRVIFNYIMINVDVFKKYITNIWKSVLLAGEDTYMGDADATVDGESCGQVLVEAVEPWPIRFVHQLGHSDYLWIKIQE